MILRSLAIRRTLIISALALAVLSVLLIASVTPTVSQDSGIGVNGYDDHGNCVCWISNQSIHGSIGVTATPQAEPTVAPQS